ncbi:MAG: DUF2157 domain-containing protein [Thermoanaerobaculia bacterium]
MFSLQPELERFRADGVLDDATAARLIAVERREVFPVYNELRLLTWAGVMLFAGGVSVLVAHHLEDIGPIVIAIAIGIAAAAAYAYAEWKRQKAASLVDEFVLLLASLLLSADIGYIEVQWHVLGSGWPRHLLVLAIIHGFVAYRFDSRLVLSLSLSSLAAYLGIERRAESLFDASIEMGLRAFLCSALIFAWREVDKRRRKPRTFQPVFEHFATNIAFWGALQLMGNRESRALGCIIALLLAVAAARYGLRAHEELFVVYAWIYGTIAIDIWIADAVDNEKAVALFVVISSIAAIVGLFVTHVRFRSTEA